MNEIIKDYDSNEIYNCDETGMFWRLLPNKTFSFKEDSTKGIKKSHDRVTVLLITNMNGNDKDIFIIGKSQNPICFRRPKDENEAKNISQVKQIYFQQKNSWMNSIIFQKIIKIFNNKMKKRNKKVLLFLDNCTSHIMDNEFSNVKLIFFPSSTTSVLQPLDQGIIVNFKSFYRKNLISFMISSLESNENCQVKKT